MRKKAASINEAINIAVEGARSGEWDLFRGQTNAIWRVTSSGERLTPEGRAEVLDRFRQFLAWAQDVEKMAGYLKDVDSPWAIAQHYGIPTNYIDFTDDPRVAAFFASDTQHPVLAEQQACIVCLNSKDFERFWQEFGPIFLAEVDNSKYPSIVQIDVANLWRLQQQRGSFLWNPIADIEQIYDFDRIVFPYTKNDPSLPVREEIYPPHQSELEKLLTQFFMNEQLREGSKAIASMGISSVSVEAKPGQYEAATWFPGGIVRSSDWSQSDLWDDYKIEHSSAALPGVSVQLEAASMEEFSDLLLRYLSVDFIEANRGKALNLKIREGVPSVQIPQRLLRCIRRLWNGMRTLPYSGVEISLAIARTLELFPLAEMNTSPSKAFGEDSLYIEMASRADGDGAYSRGTITREAFIVASNPAFLAAGRKELETRIPTLESLPDPAIARALLLLEGRPWERLTFAGLRDLMVSQIVPTQVAWRVMSDQGDMRTAIYFSPTEFKVFGLA
jgi:hypothetical protein